MALVPGFAAVGHILILSLSTQSGQILIFLPYSVMNICVVYFLMYFVVFTPYFCRYLNFTLSQLWLRWTISCYNYEKQKTQQNNTVEIRPWTGFWVISSIKDTIWNKE